MATSNGLIGNFRGKLGNIVGYQYIDANGHAVQAIRAYRPDVFNPKTLDQAQQRIKITNSVAFYKAYASLLSRSYEDRKNAHACYCRQQSLAMSMIYGETPAVPKGRRGFVPAFYIVAEGSLPERSVLSVGTTAAPQSFTTSLQVSITINNATTLGELSQDLVDNNLNLLDGDTLYFMYAVQVGTIYFNPAIVSLTLDTASSTPLVSVLSPVDQLQSVTDDSNILRLGYRSIAAYRMSQPLAGAALIQSRGSGSSHLNYSWSSSMMLPSDSVITAWYSQAAFDQAIPSYLPPLPSPSDLTLNQSVPNSGYEPEPPEPVVEEYISNGLIFRLDGIENGNTIGQWIDLISGVIFTGTAEHRDNHYFFKVSSNTALTTQDKLPIGENYTVEVVANQYQSSLSGYILVGKNNNYDWRVNTNTAFQLSIKRYVNDNIHGKQCLSLNSQRGIKNGVMLARSDQSNNLNNTINTIGGVAGGSDISRRFEGEIYAIRIYNRILTLEEVIHNQNLDNKRFRLDLNIPDEVQTVRSRPSDFIGKDEKNLSNNEK